MNYVIYIVIVKEGSHVLKAAENLSKMTAKYTLGELNENLKLGQSYL